MGCGAAGNAIQFIEKFDGLSFRHAFELLNEGPAAFTAPGPSVVKRTSIHRLETPFDPEGSDADLFASVIDYYHERLLKTPDALEYLASRGLHDLEMIKRFRLGFATEHSGFAFPKRTGGQGSRSELDSKNLDSSANQVMNILTAPLVVPVFDESDQVAEIYGRKIGKGLRKGTPMHLYLPGPHAGIWNPEALAAPELILCEAPLDALTFWTHGVQNVSFIYGTEGFPDYLLDALLKHKVQTVRLAYDNDPAGNRAAERDAERLAAQGINVYRIKFPHGMDVNEYASKVTPAQKSLLTAIKSAEWLGGSHDRAGASSSKLVATKKVATCPEPVERAMESALEKSGEYHTFELGSRSYRIGGLDKNNSLDVMKISLRVMSDDLFHLDSFDLLRDNERRRFIERAAEETRLEKELVKRDLGKVLLALERAQEKRMGEGVSSQTTVVSCPLSDEEKTEAFEFLRSPNLISRIESAFESCGLVGENRNRLAAYLACTSRKLDKPLAVIIQSTSAAGKSALMEAVLAFFPTEDQVKYSAMTGQSLYYLGETNLKHKILAIVEEEGAEKASYALKLLQSEGELTIASTGKDAHTGRMETQEYHVEGPVMIFLTTTAIDIDEELLNRCLVLTVDESKAQTERIHQLQRQARTLEGLRLKKKRQQSLKLLQNVQRLLQPVNVVNPYADQLTFTATRTRTRRDHEKYLTLIDAVALLHQHQRPRETVEGAEYIRVTLDDIELANRLAPDLLARSLDELPPQTRRVYEAVQAIVRDRMKTEEIEQRLALFSRREIRESMGWGMTQIRAHLERLKDLEYIAARCGRAGAAFQYELLIDTPESEGAGHIGLLDIEKLRVGQQPVGKNGSLSGGCRPPSRQVKVLEKPVLNGLPSACSDRTSGRLAVVES